MPTDRFAETLLARPRPLSWCPKCGAPSHRAVKSNPEICGRFRYNAPPCDGVLRPARRKADWVRCETCGGSADAHSDGCAACNSIGWTLGPKGEEGRQIRPVRIEPAQAKRNKR